MSFDDDDEEEEGPMIAPRRQKRINRKTKLHIVFDENARKDFLTGFHKRKVQRKKAAQEELKKQLKVEKKRIKFESKEQYKKMVQSYKPIPELEEQFAEEYDVDDAKVSVLELDTDLLAETNFLIGRNRGNCVEKSETDEDDEKQEESEGEEGLPGMEMTKKEIKKSIKLNATKIVQNSKAFQTLSKLEKQKNKKKAKKKKNEQKKIKAKGKKGKRVKKRN